MMTVPAQPSVLADRLPVTPRSGGTGFKIAPDHLRQLMRATSPSAPPWQLLVGNETGDDAAVYQINEHQAMVSATSVFPAMVDRPEDAGRMAVAHALSSVYAMGGQPLMATALLAYPAQSMAPGLVRRVMEGAHASCSEAGVVLAGGQTLNQAEFLFGLSMTGLVHPRQLRRNDTASAGDLLILGKPVGSGLLCEQQKLGNLSPEAYRILMDHATLLNHAGPVLAKMSEVHGMTDVGGYGLMGHAAEMARHAGLQIHLSMNRIPVLSEARALALQHQATAMADHIWSAYSRECRLSPELEIADQILLSDPQISGGLLLSCQPEGAEKVLACLRAYGCHRACVVGEFHTPDPDEEAHLMWIDP